MSAVGTPRSLARQPAPALLAVAHGSQDLRAQASVGDLLTQVRGQDAVRVVAAFLDHAAPSLPRALESLAAEGTRDVVAVPLLVTAAYHAQVDVPAQLTGVGARLPRLRVRQAGVLGPHPLLVAALERRLREAGVRPGDPSVAVVLAAAGSSDANAVASVAGVARAWARTGWWAVQPAYASAAGPTVAEAVADLRRRGAPVVVVASYLLAPGTFQDRLVATGRGADLVTQPLADAPEVAALVLLRYRQALAAAVTGRSARSA